MTNSALNRDKPHGTIVKKVARKGHDESHGGAWKVAFADFVLALMSLFLVLWVLAARDAEQALEDVRRVGGGKLFDEGGALIERMERRGGSLIPREPVPATSDMVQPRRPFTSGDSEVRSKAPLAIADRARLLESTGDFRELSAVIAQLAQDSGLRSNLQTVLTPQGLRVLLHDSERVGMFERGNAFPSDRFRTLLRRLGPVFAQVQNQLLVVGHTDSVPFANAETNPAALSNWSLANHRAMAARFHMIAGGMPTDSVLQVVGMADRAPLDLARTDADVNRRIELLVLTREHARAIAAMYGPPAAATPTVPALDLTPSERGALQVLGERFGLR